MSVRAKPTTLRAVLPKPHRHVVQKLEQWLEMARKGEIDSVVLVGEQPDGKTCYAWSGRVGVRTIGALQLVSDWLIREITRGDYE